MENRKLVYTMDGMDGYFVDRGIEVKRWYDRKNKEYKFTLIKDGHLKSYTFIYPEYPEGDTMKRYKQMTDACDAMYKDFIKFLGAVGYIDSDIATTHALISRQKTPTPTKVHFNGPVTVVIWDDGTKTLVRCSENDVYDPEKGLAMAFAKKMFGNDNSFHKLFAKWLPKEEPELFEIKLTPGQDNSEALEQVETLQQRIYRALGYVRKKEAPNDP